MKKQKLILVVSVVVVCVVVFGIYAAVRDSLSTRNEPTIPVPERAASTTIPFRAYTSPVSKVSFSIPRDWKVVEGTTVRIQSPDFVEESIPGTEAKRVTAGAAISLETEEFLINDSGEYASLIGEFHDSPDCSNCLTGHQITIAGVPAHLGFASAADSVEPNGAIISFVSGGSRYRLLMSFAAYTELDQEILAEVIHTFTLTP